MVKFLKYEFLFSSLKFECCNRIEMILILKFDLFLKDLNEYTDIDVYCAFESYFEIEMVERTRSKRKCPWFPMSKRTSLLKSTLNLLKSRGHESNGAVLDYRCSHVLYF